MNAAALPDLISSKLPDIMTQVALLTSKMKQERAKILKDDEKYLAKGCNDDDSSEGDEDIDGFEADGAEDDYEDSDEEWKKH